MFSFFSVLLLKQIKHALLQFIFVFFAIYFPYQENFPLLSYEILPRLDMLFAALILLFNRKLMEKKNFIFFIIVSAFLFALLSLEKTTNTILSVYIIALVSISFFRTQKGSYSIIFIGFFSIFLLGIWKLTGQNFSNLSTFYSTSFEFGQVYQEVIVDRSSLIEITYGFYSFGAISLFLLLRLIFALKAGKEPFIEELYFFFLFAACLFITWKHAMINTGVHVAIYFNYIGACAPLLFFYKTEEIGLYRKNLIFFQLPTGLPEPLKKVNLGGAILFLGFSALLLAPFEQNNFYRNLPGDLTASFLEKLKSVGSFSPIVKKKELELKNAEFIQRIALSPQLRQEISDSRVDEFGHVAQALMLNHLNYKPRPVNVDFIAISPDFSKLNLDFYQDPKTAPKYVFVNFNPALHIDDSESLVELLVNYQYLAEYTADTRSWIILKRKNNIRTWNKELLHEGNIQFGQKITKEFKAGDYIWVEAEIRRSLFGRLVSFLYKPDKINMYYTVDQQKGESVRGTVLSLSTGFLMNPMISSGAHIQEVLQNGPFRQITDFKFEVLQNLDNVSTYSDEIKLKFYKININK